MEVVFKNQACKAQLKSMPIYSWVSPNPDLLPANHCVLAFFLPALLSIKPQFNALKYLISNNWVEIIELVDWIRPMRAICHLQERSSPILNLILDPHFKSHLYYPSGVIGFPPEFANYCFLTKGSFCSCYSLGSPHHSLLNCYTLLLSDPGLWLAGFVRVPPHLGLILLHNTTNWHAENYL